MTTPVRTRLIERDRGARALFKRLERAARDKSSLRVGIFGKSAAEPRGPDVTLVQIAQYHEFGRGDNPERSFIRATFDAQRRALEELQRRIGRGVLLGRFSERQGLELLGEFIVAKIRERIRSAIPPGLKPSTKRRKGPNKTIPLIDTGQLVQSITHEIER